MSDFTDAVEANTRRSEGYRQRALKAEARLDALTAQIEELERERDSLVKQTLAQGAWMEGAMRNFAEVAAADARAEVAEQRVEELAQALEAISTGAWGAKAHLANYDVRIYARAALAQPEDLG